jgi:hypothetical protein
MSTLALVVSELTPCGIRTPFPFNLAEESALCVCQE